MMEPTRHDGSGKRKRRGTEFGLNCVLFECIPKNHLTGLGNLGKMLSELHRVMFSFLRPIDMCRLSCCNVSFALRIEREEQVFMQVLERNRRLKNLVLANGWPLGMTKKAFLLRAYRGNICYVCSASTRTLHGAFYYCHNCTKSNNKLFSSKDKAKELAYKFRIPRFKVTRSLDFFDVNARAQRGSKLYCRTEDLYLRIVSAEEFRDSTLLSEEDIETFRALPMFAKLLDRGPQAFTADAVQAMRDQPLRIENAREIMQGLHPRTREFCFQELYAYLVYEEISLEELRHAMHRVSFKLAELDRWLTHNSEPNRTSAPVIEAMQCKDEDTLDFVRSLPDLAIRSAKARKRMQIVSRLHRDTAMVVKPNTLEKYIQTGSAGAANKMFSASLRLDARDRRYDVDEELFRYLT